MNLKEKITGYFRKRKTGSLIFDFFFYLFILLLLIPGTRKAVAPVFIRTFLHAPIFLSKGDQVQLTDEDYRWPLQDQDENPVFLNRYRDEVVILNFWATWCPPCRAEMPSLQKLYNDYKDKVRFILVTSEDPATVQQFMKEQGYDLPVYYQKYAAPKHFSSRSVPTTYIINRQGTIVLEHKGASKWNAPRIRRMLDGLVGNES